MHAVSNLDHLWVTRALRVSRADVESDHIPGECTLWYDEGDQVIAQPLSHLQEARSA